MNSIGNFTRYIAVLITTSGIQAQTTHFKGTDTGSVHHPYQEMEYLLSDYIKIESESGNEIEAGLFLSEVCESRGLHVRRFTEENDSYNFAASIYPLESGKPNIILLNHLDVVSHGHDEEWTFPPYSGVIEDSMVWGRGAIDNKGMAVMQLEAITEILAMSQDGHLPFNVTLLSVSSEEVGGEKGAGLVCDSFLQELNPILVLGEGGSGISGIVTSKPGQVVYGVSVAHKRGLWLRLKLDMHTSGHGSVPPKEYVNKVMIASLARLSKRRPGIRIKNCSEQMFRSLGNLENGLKGFVLRHPGLFKPLISPALRKEEMISAMVSNTITLTNMSNPPASVNVISQSAEAILDCRLLPETDTQEFLQMISSTLNDERIRIEIIHETVKAGCTNKPALFNELSSAIRSVDPNAGVVPILFPAFNDNNYFRSKGISVFGIMPAHMEKEMIEGIHNVNERIAIKSLYHGRDIYREFLIRMMTSSLIPEFLSQNRP